MNRHAGVGLIIAAMCLGTAVAEGTDQARVDAIRSINVMTAVVATGDPDAIWFDGERGVVETIDGIAIFTVDGGLTWHPFVRPSDSHRTRRRLVRRPSAEQNTLVRVGDEASFSSSHYAVSGTATIISDRLIRINAFSSNGSAPGLDIRIGLDSQSRKDFEVLRVVGRQSFQDATIDLEIPEGITLDDFDTFTVWCFEFDVLIAEGRFERP